MRMVPQKELRNNVSDVLRRAEAGEEITVSGRPVAHLGPLRKRQWVRGSELAALADLPPDPTLMEEIESFESEAFDDPWPTR
ncbi:MAG: type II toxin-antitoxin system prevent-host-death family antitoxin [Actinobacteria bacterium]|nr:type II toxin-antitoxin system prevent-host-death family antitoxin [Actinomycetota bacterium]